MELHQHGEIKFNEGEYLWKYFDLHKFISFMIERKLHFTRLDDFDDPLDGLTDRTISELNTYENIPQKREDLNRNFPEATKDYILKDQSDRKRFIDESSKETQTTQFANCWFVSKKESIAMWKLYSNPDSVAIRFKPDNLLSMIKDSAANCDSNFFKLFLFGRVDYKDIWPIDFLNNSTSEFNAFKKDSSYIHEHEFRFISVVPAESKGMFQSFKLPLVDIEKQDFLIFTNPYMQDWKFTNLMMLLENYSLDKKLNKSNLKVKIG